MNWNRALIPALLVLPVLVILALGFGKDPHELPFAMKDKPAPSLQLATLDGGSFAPPAGKPLVINFWSTWCVPCKVEHEVLQEGAKAWTDRVQFVGVVYQDDAVAAKTYLEKRGNAYPQLLDPGSKIAIELGVSGVPETFFIDAGGVVRAKFAGALTPAVLHGELQRLLAGGSGS
jgi:cytochrome c biogenesis protein CcmG, thiol:disulfide interchange protein DsbE